MSSSGAEMSRDELGATLAARQELGKDYEPALVDALAERVEQVVQARVAAQVAQAGGAATVAPFDRQAQRPLPAVPGAMPWQARLCVALVSLGVGIPVTAIAGGEAGLGGVIVTWGGIVVVNLAAAVSPRSRSSR
jgi:hypothetical protein